MNVLRTDICRTTSTQCEAPSLYDVNTLWMLSSQDNSVITLTL